VTRRKSAAVLRLAALGAMLAAPSITLAQLRCENTAADTLIRRVSFEGNTHFTDKQLAAHVFATPTDISQRVIKHRGRDIGIGASVGALIGVATTDDKLKGGIYGATAGALVGAFIDRVVGTPRCLRPGLLAADALNLRTFYVDQGFPDVKVDTASRFAENWVDLEFRITEGAPALVDSVSVTGLGNLDLGADLQSRLNSRKGARYSRTRVQADVDTIEARMRNAAHPLGFVLPQVTFLSPDRLRAIVALQVDTGPRTRIGKITISNSGIDNRPAVIDSSVVREILRFKEGDAYSERALAESERQFYRVGNFLSAEITIVDTLQAAKDGTVDVHVRVLEDLMHSFSIEPGYGTLDCLRARVEYTDKGFLKGLNRLDVSGQVSKIGWANEWNFGVRQFCGFTPFKLADDEVASDSVNYNVTVKLTRPLTLRGGLLPSLSAYRERRGGYNAYLRTTLIGASAAIQKSLPRSILAQGSYTLEYGHTSAQETVLCFLFRACDEPTRDQLVGDDKRLAILGGSFSRDRRNNPDSTTSGTVLRLDLRMSQPWIGSDSTLSFNKGVVDAAWYRRFGPGVVALRLRGGLVGGGLATTGGRLPPPQERLYTGGETSVRGYSQNELGPLIYVTADDTAKLAAAPTAAERLDSLQSMRMRVIPAGGNAMYVGNLEYRLRGPFLPTLQTILFLDAGMLSTQSGLARSGQDLKLTPGIAFRYFSPIGAIQVNLGYNGYDRPDGPVFLDRGVGSLSCLSGGTSAACPSVTAIKPLLKSDYLKRITLTVAFPPDF
jgi:outer membrane protein assembly factor BamA